MTLETLREISIVVGFVASVVLAYRLASTWDETSWLTKALGLSLGATVALTAFASSRLVSADQDAIPSVVYTILVTRLLALFVGVFWLNLLRRKDRSS